jgi:hypothetical protein
MIVSEEKTIKINITFAYQSDIRMKSNVFRANGSNDQTNSDTLTSGAFNFSLLFSR